MAKPRKFDRRRLLKDGAAFGLAAGAMGLASARRFPWKRLSIPPSLRQASRS